jgi:hypothetical protein|tara:strand:+ start:2239 stop:2598 length:360 start_codon:yes stop_codon:yes gene_type:complete
MEFNLINNFLLQKVKEEHIINKIKLMANPSISKEIKKDLTTFFFVWNAIQPFLLDEYITCVLFSVHKIATLYNDKNKIIKFPQNANLIKYINFIKKYLLSFTSLKRLLVLKELNLLKTE